MPSITALQFLLEDRDDPFGRDWLELGVRVADCFEVQGTDNRSIQDYLKFWCGVAQLDAMIR